MRLQILSKMSDVIINNRVRLLSILFMMLFAMFVYFVYQSISLDYLPIFSDEYGYHLGAKYFQICGRPDAAFTMNEYYSVIGNSSFYGFIYYAFYGIFFKLFALLGITPSIMLVNIFLTLIFFLLLGLSKIPWEQKLFIGIVFLSNFIFILFLSSSMTENFHYIFGVIVAYPLYLLYKTGEKRYLYILIFLIMLLSLFRPAWIFVLFGILPLSSSFKSFLKYLSLVVLGLFYVILIEKYLYASNPFSFMYVFMSHLQQDSFLDSITFLYEHFLSNIDNYFIAVPYGQYRFVFYYKYLYFALLIYSIYSSIVSRDRSILAGTIVAVIYFLSVMSIYDAFQWREVRVLAAPFMLLTTILILNSKYLPVLLIIIFQLSNLNAVVDHKYEDDAERVSMHSRIDESRNLLNDFMDFRKYLPSYKKNNILILLNRNIFPNNDSPLFFQLPVHLDNKCIRYSTIYRSGIDMKDSRCDIFISSSAENISNMKLLGKNKNFYFYKRIEQEGQGTD